MDDKMKTARDIDELRRLERFCVELAQEAGTAEGRAALLSMAANYRAAAERSAQPDRDQ
jgi:hypothetical protein